MPEITLAAARIINLTVAEETGLNSRTLDVTNEKRIRIIFIEH